MSVPFVSGVLFQTPRVSLEQVQEKLQEFLGMTNLSQKQKREQTTLKNLEKKLSQFQIGNCCQHKRNCQSGSFSQEEQMVIRQRVWSFHRAADRNREIKFGSPKHVLLNRRFLICLEEEYV